LTRWSGVRPLFAYHPGTGKLIWLYAKEGSVMYWHWLDGGSEWRS